MKAGHCQLLGRQALAALSATAGENLLTALGGHAAPEAMATLTHQFARLICTLHGYLLLL